jgi:hypothetical protein
MFYEFKGAGHSFKCKECNLIKNEPNWHCRTCEFDICQNCGINHNYNPFGSGIKCKNNHPLVKSVIRSATIGNLQLIPKCDCCKENFSGDGYICSECNYILCNSCYVFYTYPTAGHPVFRCQNSHLLRWNPTSQFQCDICFQKPTQEHYRCKECNFDICMRCSDILLKNIVENVKKTHGPNQHPLVWVGNMKDRTGGASGQCVSCNIQFKNAGMFCCTQCSNNYCLLCYDDPNRAKPQILSRGNSFNDLKELLLFASQLNK